MPLSWVGIAKPGFEVRTEKRTRVSSEKRALGADAHKAADANVGALAAAFKRAVAATRGHVSEAKLTAAYDRKDAEAIVAIALRDFEKVLGASVEPVVAKIVVASGQAAAARLLGTPGTLRRMEKGALAKAPKPAVGPGFDLKNRRAHQAAGRVTAHLVREVSNKTKSGIRAVIKHGFEAGEPPRTMANAIRDLVGLTERQAIAVQSYRAGLAGIAADRADDLALAYADRLLSDRALLIARTETIRASAEGQNALWSDAVDNGLLDPASTQKSWIVTHDERLDEVICAPMDGQVVDLDEEYDTGDGDSVDHPPAHPGCRCSEGLVFGSGAGSGSGAEGP